MPRWGWRGTCHYQWNVPDKTTPSVALSRKSSMLQTISERTPPAETLTGNRASTGIPGLDEILGGGLPANHLYLIDGEPGSRQDHARTAVSPRGRPTSASGDSTSRSRRAAKSCRRCRSPTAGLSTASTSSSSRRRSSAKRTRATRSSTRPRWSCSRRVDACSEGRRGAFSAARGVRLALRDAPPRARPAPLSSPDPRSQAVLRRTRLHRAAARRQDGARAVTSSCTVSRTASSRSSTWHWSTAPSGAGCR